MNFIRDIAIPIILLLSVGAIISSVNIQLTDLLTLGGPNDVIVIRDTKTQIDNSIIEPGILHSIPMSNIRTIVPLVYLNVSVEIIKENKTVISNLSFVSGNLSTLNKIIPISIPQQDQLTNLSAHEVILGSELAKSLNLNSESIKDLIIYIPNTNESLQVRYIAQQADNFANSILIQNSSIKLINKTYNNDYYSEILLQVKDKTKIVNTATNIQNVLASSDQQCNCKIFQGSGTNFLLSGVLSKIIEQLFIFNAILAFIVIIRVLQTLLWIAQEYKYEINEMKIIGASNIQIYLLFIVIGLLMESLGFILGALGSIFVPVILTYAIALITLQSLTIIPPALDQIFLSYIQLTVLTVLVIIIPAYKLATSRVLKQKQRE